MEEVSQELALKLVCEDLPSPEDRNVQAMLYKRLLEKNLTISVLEQFKQILDLDICVVACENCYISVKLGPDSWQNDVHSGGEINKMELESVCAMIQSGRCDCGQQLEPTEAKTIRCRLLHLTAMSREYLPLLMYLAREGCDLDLVVDSETPLTVAIAFDQIEVVKYLLSQNVELNGEKASPLGTAIHFDREDMVDMLLETKKINLNDSIDRYGGPALISCVRMHPEFVEQLLKAGASPDIAGKWGSTALMYAVNSRDIDLVKMLIRYGADVNMKNRRGEMALDIVIYREDEQLVEILLDAGADPNSHTMDAHNSYLLLASYDGCLDITKALIRHGAKVDCPNDLGYTPIHIAAWNGHLECVKLLLKAGSPHDQRTKDGNTPLALAAHGNHLKVMEELLPLGCDVNNSDKDMDTPLQYAAYNGMTRAVELLIEHGAEPNALNSVNASALWNAVYQKHKEVVKLLLTANVEMERESMGINQHSQSDQVVYVYSTQRSPLWVATAQNTPDIALLLITAGYDIHKEKWLLDGDFPESATNTRLNNMLTHYAHTPQRLVAICRNYFRHLFQLEIKPKVQELIIPETLKNYITLADMKYIVGEEKEETVNSLNTL